MSMLEFLKNNEAIADKNGQIYAVLFNAYKQKRFTNELIRTYTSLIHAGVPDKNIIFLEDDGNQNRLANGPATQKYLEYIIKSLSHIATKNDRFLFQASNHGIKTKNEKYLQTYDEMISPHEIQQMLKNLNTNYNLLIFTQCYSGKFAEVLGKERNIAISSTKPDETCSSNIFAENPATIIDFLFPNILYPDTSIYEAFKYMKYEMTSDERIIHKKNQKRGFEYPLTIDDIDPQIVSDYTNPGHLHLGNNLNSYNEIRFESEQPIYSSKN